MNSTIKTLSIVALSLLACAFLGTSAFAQSSTSPDEAVVRTVSTARTKTAPNLASEENTLSATEAELVRRIKKFYMETTHEEASQEVIDFIKDQFKGREHEVVMMSDAEFAQALTPIFDQMIKEAEKQEQIAQESPNNPNVSKPPISSSTLKEMAHKNDEYIKTVAPTLTSSEPSVSSAPTATSTPAPQNNEPVIVNMEPTAPVQQQEGQPAVIEPTQQYSVPYDPVYQNEAEPQQATARPATISDMIQAAATSEVTEGAIPQAAPFTQTKEPESFPEAIAMTLQGVGAAIASNEVLRAGIIALPILLIALFGGFAISRNEDYQPKVEVKGRVRRRKKAKESDIPQDTSGDVPFRATKINILTAAE